MSSPTYDIPLDHLIIPVAGTFERTWCFDDADGGDPDWTGWSGRSQIRDGYGGDLLAEMSTDGADGTVMLGESGNVTIYLPSSFTTDLSPTTTAVGDLYLTNPDGDAFRVLEFRVKITQEVTR